MLASILLLVVGCSPPGTQTTGAGATNTSSGTAQAAIEPDCLAPQVLSALGFDRPDSTRVGAHADAPGAGTIPEGFVPVLVVECSTGQTLTDDAGQWLAVTATRREGDVDALLATLTAETTPTPSPSGTCVSGGQRSVLWLVDTMGEAIRVTVPGTRCGRLSSAVRDALDDLDAVDVEQYAVQLVVPLETVS